MEKWYLVSFLSRPNVMVEGEIFALVLMLFAVYFISKSIVIFHLCHHAKLFADSLSLQST